MIFERRELLIEIFNILWSLIRARFAKLRELIQLGNLTLKKISGCRNFDGNPHENIPSGKRK